MYTNENLITNGTRWLPEAASTYAKNVDVLFYFIIYGSIGLFAGIMIVIIGFSIRYRRRKDNQKASGQISHNNQLEIIWSVIPLIVVLVIFVWGFVDYLKMSLPPQGTIEYRLTGQKWSWIFSEPKTGATLGNQLVVPVNQPVKLIMTSLDVIHSFYVPNFRIKKDILPNRYTMVWFEANREGIYQVFCTEYCGDSHSTMLGSVRVVSQEEYAKHLDELSSLSDLSPVQLGELVYKQRCIACHSIDGSRMTGPTWKGIYGSSSALANGQNTIVDDTYIRESILKPQTKIVKGYEPAMPSFAGQLKEREIEGIIEYYKTLK